MTEKAVSSSRVVIVGGGLAGLSAAEALASQYPGRFQITVLESKQSVGGRAGSFADPRSGETVDYCQHVAMGCCTNLIGLFDRCGLADQFQRHRELLFLHPDHPPSRFAPSRWLPPPLHLSRPLAALQFLNRSQRREIRRGILRLFRTRSDDLVGLTAAEWLSSAGQDDSTIRDFWNVILVSALGERPDVVSMAVARKVFVDGFAGAVGASDVLVPRQPLSDLIGHRLREAIQAKGVTISTGRKVKRIDTDEHGMVETDDGECCSAEHVIVAVPWHTVDSIVPKQLIPGVDRFADFPTSPISGVHLWFDRQWTQADHAVLVGTVSQWMFRQPWESSQAADGSFYYQIVISASQEAKQIPKEDLVQKVVDEIRSAFPAARDAKLVRSRIVTDPNSVFSVRPEVEAVRPSPTTPLPWLHLAGDWIATGWPATMEGAVISGRMAASDLSAREGLPAIPIDPGLPRGWLARHLIK